MGWGAPRSQSAGEGLPQTLSENSEAALGRLPVPSGASSHQRPPSRYNERAPTQSQPPGPVLSQHVPSSPGAILVSLAGLVRAQNSPAPLERSHTLSVEAVPQSGRGLGFDRLATLVDIGKDSPRIDRELEYLVSIDWRRFSIAGCHSESLLPERAERAQ